MPLQAETSLSNLTECTDDVAERKRVCGAVAEGDAQLRKFFAENTSVMLLVEPSGGTIAAANHAAATFYGYPLEQLVGMPISRINILPQEEVAREWDQAAREQRSVFRFFHRLANGQVRDVEVYSSPLYIDGVYMLLSIIHDVTGRVIAEQTLRESAESLLEAQRIAGIGSYDLDITAGIWTSSEVMDEIFGIGKEYPHTVVGWTALIPPSERAMMAAYLAEEVLGKGQPFDREYRIVRQTDREERWVHGHGRLDIDSNGLPVRLRGTIQDITARKQAEDALRNSEERYRATFEQVAVGIVHASFDGSFLRCNARFAEITGYSQQEIPGMTLLQITPPEDHPQSESVRQQLASGVGGVTSWEKRYIRKDGSLTWVKVTASVQRDAEGRPLHLIVLVEDINARRRAEERLAASALALKVTEERYRTVFQTCPDAVAISRVNDGVILDVNEAFLDSHGFDLEGTIGRKTVELGLWVNPSDRQAFVEAVRRDGSIRDLEVLSRRSSGETFWMRLSATLIEIEGSECLFTIARDISESRAAEQKLAAMQEALRTSELRYRTSFQLVQDAIDICRMDDGKFLDVNDEFVRITGFSREEVIGRTGPEIGIWANPADRQRLLEELRLNSVCRNLEIPYRTKDGALRWGLLSVSKVDLDGVPSILSVTRDITDAKAAQDEIRNLAFYDPLTGLPNRRLFHDRLRQTLTVSSRRGRKQALLFVDLDNFKNLNDTLGHQIGDLLLQEVGSRLRSCVRETDTVARLGGDEFLIMLEDLGQTAEDAASRAEAIANKVLASIEQPYSLVGRECSSSASIGITIFGDCRETSNEVMQQADIAMYNAKSAGRNTIRFFAPALQTAVFARAALEDELRHGIKANQFVLFYQPQVDCNRLIGAESLIRWNHPRRGLLLPGEFISLAEDTGLIVPLGNWILESACARIAAWGKSNQATSISVNISARQFRQPGFVQNVISALDCAQASPHRLTLELTESLLLDDVDETIAKMEELRLLGVRFSLDDFGTGYSSLSYLRRLPLDQLKIDRAFVRDLLGDISSSAIAQAVISLGRARGLSIIAEGVETEEQRDRLATLGCHAYQGFLFSRPLPAEEFERVWLQTQVRAALEVR
ncbi:MAG: PAS domain S-box protein [Terracidiphilus sp.]|jgi:diguanylate cyclase (GGDEF)-like protein/PAS domain S-box-containing protein